MARATALLLMAALVLAGLPPQLQGQAPVQFIRGDANGDGAVDISDSIATLAFLFLGNPAKLECDDAADSNDDGTVDISDPVRTLEFMFLGTGEIPPPQACG